MASRGRQSSTNAIWNAMKQRCLNPSNSSYHKYGARGITVCKRWLVFKDFLADMGERPEGLSIERRDNNGNYEPDNCYWATPAEQSVNTRRTYRVEFRGRIQALKRWSQEFGINYSTLRARLRRNWSIEKALLTPPL